MTSKTAQPKVTQVEEIQIRTKEELVSSFYKTVLSLVKKLDAKSKTEMEKANLERLRKRMSLLRQGGGDEALIREASPYLQEYKSQIMSRDEDFFMNADFREKYKSKVSKTDAFVFDLMDKVKSYYSQMKPAEKDVVYGEIKSLYLDSTEYLYVLAV